MDTPFGESPFGPRKFQCFSSQFALHGLRALDFWPGYPGVLLGSPGSALVAPSTG